MENQESRSFPGKGQPVDPNVQMTNTLELSGKDFSDCENIPTSEGEHS